MALQSLALALRSGNRDPEAWRDAVASIGEELLLRQTQAAAQADVYVSAALQAQGASASADAEVNPAAFADLTDGGGSWLRNLVFAPNAVRSAALAAGLSRPLAESRASLVAQSIVLTGIQDVGRSAVQASMLSRPDTKGYVRMLRGKSCSRCAILAGRHYRAATAFRRHPRCDCVNIPAAESVSDLTTDPMTYFRSLSRAEQDEIFGEASSQAIRDGADISQVVNAQKGTWTVNAYGRDVRATLEGTTKRGIAGQRLSAEGFTKTTGPTDSRYAYSRTPRLLPDEIYSLAEEFGWDRAEILRQLQRFAYII